MIEFDEDVVREILGKYGLDADQFLSAGHKKPKAEQDWIYLIHHFHPPKKAEEMETVHHCIMFTKKNLKGAKYEQMHVKEGKIFLHALKMDKKDLNKAPEVVYDHLNNSFKVVVKEVDGKKYAIMTGPVKLANVKWSDQDK